MLGKFKQILGIEGVKVQVILPDHFDEDGGVIHGKILMTTKNNQIINSILIQFVERFSRGRKAEKRIDEYVIGKLFLEGPISIDANQKIEKDFELEYSIARSEMDHMEDQNILFKGLVKLAKFFNKVKSEYRLEIEVDVKGTTLNPIVKEEIKLG